MKKRILLVALLVIHSVVTVLAMSEFGFIAIFEKGLADWATRQVFSDLCVSLILINIWMISDARKRGTSAMPFVLASLPLGSFAPMAYLIWRELPARAVAKPALPA